MQKMTYRVITVSTTTRTFVQKNKGLRCTQRLKWVGILGLYLTLDVAGILIDLALSPLNINRCISLEHNA